MYKSLFVSLSFFALLSGGSCESMPDKMNVPLEKNMKLFGVTVYRRRAPKMSKKDEMVQEVKGIRRQDDFEEAEQHFFDVIERAEKKIINVAKTLVRDEVDTLFGKDHGHPIHDDPCDKSLSSEKQAPVWLL